MRLIDADALIENAKNFHCIECERRKGMKNGKLKFVYEIGDAPCRACDVADMIDALDEAPTVDAVPVRHGRWLKGGYVCGETEWICSVCGKTEWRTNCNRMKYCMFCGAAMDLEEVDDAKTNL